MKSSLEVNEELSAKDKKILELNMRLKKVTEESKSANTNKQEIEATIKKKDGQIEYQFLIHLGYLERKSGILKTEYIHLMVVLQN